MAKKSKPIPTAGPLETLSAIVTVLKAEKISLEETLKTVFGTFDPTYTGFDTAKEAHSRAVNNIGAAIASLEQRLAGPLKKVSAISMYSVAWATSSHSFSTTGERDSAELIVFTVPKSLQRFLSLPLGSIGVVLEVRDAGDLTAKKPRSIDGSKIHDREGEVVGTSSYKVTAIF